MSILKAIAETRGSAAINAIVIMTIMGILGAAFISFSSTELKISANYRDGVAAQYLAEAGAQWALVQLETNNVTIANKIQTTGTYSFSPSQKKNSGVTEGNYQVTISNPDHPKENYQRRIVSVGTVKGSGANRQIVLNVTVSSGSSENAFSYGLFSGSNMTINNSGRVNGSVRSNTLINLHNSAVVTGDAISHSIVNRDKASVGGKVLENSPTMNVPVFKRSDYQTGNTSLRDLGNSDSFTLNGGVYYETNGFTMGNSSVLRGDGIIYVVGNVIIGNSAQITGNVLIIAEGDINFHNSAQASHGVFYATNNITVGNSAEVTGSLVAKGTIDVHNSGQVTYDKNIVSRFNLLGTSGSFSVNKISKS